MIQNTPQQKPSRNWDEERKMVDMAAGELTFLVDWVIHHPQIASQLAIEAHELARRYVEDPMDGIEFRAIIPTDVWRQFQMSCIKTSEPSCYEKLQDILFKAMQDFIMLNKSSEQ